MSNQQYDNTNKGTLFRNDRKTSDRQPDHTGSLNVEGVDYWVSAWVKESRDGKKFFSMALTRKDEQAKSQEGRNFDDFDNGRPF